MSVNARIRELIERLTHNLWIRLVLSLTTATVTYLEFKNAGLSWLFWVLCVLTLLIASSVAISAFKKWIRERREQTLHYDHQHKLETLDALTKEFATFEKAKRLEETLDIEENIRILIILPVEGRLGVMLNTGKENAIQTGTPLLVYRTDEYTSNGEHIEERLGLVQVTYVQAGNNCSQAIVIERLDRDFWDLAAQRLEREKRIAPPRNFAVPYVPAELVNLSSEDLRVFRRYLETIRDSLIRAEPDYQPKEDLS